MNEPAEDRHIFSFPPTFSTSFLDTNMLQSETQTPDLPQSTSPIQKSLTYPDETSGRLFRKYHQDSISDSSAVGSNDSSPTTTISTVDDSSATDPSPGSSPESPPPASFETGMNRPRTADDGRPYFELAKQPPPRKGRNLKNLAVNTSRAPARPLSTASLPLPSTEPRAELSPGFFRPNTPSRRRPSNLGLTLLTPGSAKPALQEIRLAIPPTPSLARPGMLRHFQSSPSLPLFPGIAEQTDGGHQAQRDISPETVMSPTMMEPESIPEEDERNYEVPLSQEQKPEAYPDGPICVYEPYVDLYLEPTVDQCRQYDVIMNVASEVINPFVAKVEDKIEPDIRIDGGGGIQYAPIRERVVQQRGNDDLDSTNASTTPKATPLEPTFDAEEITPRPRKDPEYIHIQWEHNSDIVPELLDLVKLMDERIAQGKRVLVHCQCGVSRSASLVVAYGLYKDPALSVQEAYDKVKGRSHWIGPNMNLIMQLQEFRTSLMHGGLLSVNRGMTPITPGSAFGAWHRQFPTKTEGSTVTRSRIVTSPIEANVEAGHIVPEGGSSSAPSTAGLPPPTADLLPPARARAVSAVDPSGRVVPILLLNSDATTPVATVPETAQVEQASPETVSPMSREPSNGSPAEAEFALTPLQPSPDVDPADSFGLMSPSTTEFSSSPFDRAALLSRLGMNPVAQEINTPPRRSLSLRNKKTSTLNGSGELLSEGPKTQSRLRIKVSSPDLHEQHQLQKLRADIDASQGSAPFTAELGDPALLSPRATEFTQNPFALASSIPPSPANADTPTESDSDPRSPVQEKGGSPITRSIFDVL